MTRNAGGYVNAFLDWQVESRTEARLQARAAVPRARDFPTVALRPALTLPPKEAADQVSTCAREQASYGGVPRPAV